MKREEFNEEALKYIQIGWDLARRITLAPSDIDKEAIKTAFGDIYLDPNVSYTMILANHGDVRQVIDKLATAGIPAYIEKPKDIMIGCSVRYRKPGTPNVRIGKCIAKMVKDDDTKYVVYYSYNEVEVLHDYDIIDIVDYGIGSINYDNLNE